MLSLRIPLDPMERILVSDHWLLESIKRSSKYQEPVQKKIFHESSTIWYICCLLRLSWKLTLSLMPWKFLQGWRENLGKHCQIGTQEEQKATWISGSFFDTSILATRSSHSYRCIKTARWQCGSGEEGTRHYLWFFTHLVSFFWRSNIPETSFEFIRGIGYYYLWLKDRNASYQTLATFEYSCTEMWTK